MRFLIILIFLTLSHLTQSIRLINRQTHYQSQLPTQLSTMQNINTNIASLKSSINNNLISLNNYNQDQRITYLESLIPQLRMAQFKIFNSTIFNVSSNSYCYNITKQLQSQASNLAEINDDLINTPANQIINQIKDPVITVDTSMDKLQSAITNNDTYVKSANITNSSNLLGSGWFPASNVNKSEYSNKSEVCPLSYPYVSLNGSCMSCGNYYYDVGLKSCVDCKSYDEVQHVCKDVATPSIINGTTTPTNTSVIHPTNTTNTTANTSTTTNTTSNLTTPPTTNTSTSPINTTTQQPIVNQFVSNPNNLTGVIIPQNKTLEQYKSELAQHPNNVSLITCPISTPFFDGTKCISCYQKQYFSAQKRTCLTCPEFYIYNPATYHCDTLKYYSNPLNTSWVSIGTPPSNITQNNQNLSSQLDYQPCPLATPYFNGQNCIACVQPTPLYSYDGKSCTACVVPTVFDKNLHTCLNVLNRQTNPSTAPNLIFSGRPLNEWNGYYYNNQTANPQISDCPSTVPYFDGATCITCPSQTPYFNLEFRICQTCANGESYGAQSRECLTVFGNIVTQQPSLMKMAATIFG